MVLTKDTEERYASWESKEVTRQVVSFLGAMWTIFPQAVHDEEYGHVTLVRVSCFNHEILEGVAIYPESITQEAPYRPGVQIVCEKLNLQDLRKGTGEKRVVAGPVWLGDNGIFEEDPK